MAIIPHWYMLRGRRLLLAGIVFFGAGACARKSSELVVTMDGIGPLRFGMTLPEARAALPTLDFPRDSAGCAYASAPDLPGAQIMVEDGHIVRVDIDSLGVRTAEGAGVGDSIASVQELYGSRMSTFPNKYTAEPDLLIRAAEPRDTVHQLIFETFKGRVVRYRAGQKPQVAYVERCG